MIAALALLALTPVTYSFPAGAAVRYDLGITFDGFVPILGGQEGKVVVTADVLAKGLAADSEGRPQVSSEITKFKLTFNDATIPLGLDKVEAYLPKTVASIAPEGLVLKSDAPNVKVPVRLPGLDVKRFPDMTYLPIQFPTGGVELGQVFSYKKSYGDSEATYEVTPTVVDDKQVKLGLKFSQHYETLEDDALNLVPDEKDAVRRVSSDVKGTGTATFDRRRKLVSELRLEGSVDSTATDLETQKTSQRHLKTLTTVRVKP